MTASKLSFWNRIFDDIISREVYSRLDFTSEWVTVHIFWVAYIFSLFAYIFPLYETILNLFSLFIFLHESEAVKISVLFDVLSRFHVFVLFSYIKAAWCLYIELRELRISIG